MKEEYTIYQIATTGASPPLNLNNVTW